MQSKLTASLILVACLTACSETPPPPADVNVNVTVEEKAPPEKAAVIKEPRSTIIGDGQSYTRP